METPRRAPRRTRLTMARFSPISRAGAYARTRRSNDVPSLDSWAKKSCAIMSREWPSAARASGALARSAGIPWRPRARFMSRTTARSVGDSRGEAAWAAAGDMKGADAAVSATARRRVSIGCGLRAWASEPGEAVRRAAGTLQVTAIVAPDATPRPRDGAPRAVAAPVAAPRARAARPPPARLRAPHRAAPPARARRADPHGSLAVDQRPQPRRRVPAAARALRRVGGGPRRAARGRRGRDPAR